MSQECMAAWRYSTNDNSQTKDTSYPTPPKRPKTITTFLAHCLIVTILLVVPRAFIRCC